MTLKKIRAAVCALLAMTVTFCGVYAAAFSDVDPNTDVGRAITEMYEKGYIQGFGDGSFRPQSTLTRAEFVTIINKMYGYRVPAENIFTDINEKSWYYTDVMCAVAAGYIKGMGDGTFRPNVSVTREQVCVMLDSILKTERFGSAVVISDSVSEWARESVEKLVANRMFSLEAGNRFRATEPITRGEVCAALEKCIIDTDADYGEIDMEGMVREELEKKLTALIKVMKEKVIPSMETADTKKVAEMICAGLEEYLKDPEYDYDAATKAAYSEYERLSESERDNLKSLILNNSDGGELMLLFDFFYSEN